MPKLDGMSATSLIRRFDHMTPIISMTSNSQPHEVVKYYSSGMNDILPKPFTKDDLLKKLEVCSDFASLLDSLLTCSVQKHLIHLKAEQLRRLSRSPLGETMPSIDTSDRASADSEASLPAKRLQKRLLDDAPADTVKRCRVEIP